MAISAYHKETDESFCNTMHTLHVDGIINDKLMETIEKYGPKNIDSVINHENDYNFDFSLYLYVRNIEDAMLIYRTSRAPERRVFKVFVGNMDDKDVEPYVQRVANKFKRDQVVDNKTGNVDLRFNQMAVDQDYFIPVRDPAQASPIETLAGAQNLSEIADIEYIQKKLVTALRIPKAYLGFEEPVGDGKNLSLLDIRFARTINRIQKCMIAELNKIAIIHLFLLGFEDELTNFTLGLHNPSKQSDLLGIELWKEKITLYKDAVAEIPNTVSPVSASWAKKHIL